MAHNEIRRAGVTIVVLSTCLALMGCVGIGNYISPPTAMPEGNTTSLSGSPNRQGSGTFASLPNTEIQQLAYSEPMARFGPNPQGLASVPDDTVVESAMMGPPIPGEMPPQPNLPLPTELNRVTHPPHRVAPPDILYLEALRLVPRGPYRLEPLEVLAIEVPENTFPRQDIRGNFMISPEGTINLGFNYGKVRVGGLTVDEAHQAIRDHLNNIIKTRNVNVALAQMRGMQNIRGEHLVRPDGTIHLGMYGSVFVAGMDLGQVKCQIEKHLEPYLVDPRISVDVFAYNSRKIFIIADGAGYGQQVITLPATGGETVLEAIGRVQGLPPVASKKRIWVARPSPVGHPCSIVLPVDWEAITQAGRTETNYQLLPGDRIYISADRCIMVYNYLDKVLAPIERVLGVTLIGTSVVNSIRGTSTGVLVAR